MGIFRQGVEQACRKGTALGSPHWWKGPGDEYLAANKALGNWLKHQGNEDAFVDRLSLAVGLDYWAPRDDVGELMMARVGRIRAKHPEIPEEAIEEAEKRLRTITQAEPSTMAWSRVYALPPTQQGAGSELRRLLETHPQSVVSCPLPRRILLLNGMDVDRIEHMFLCLGAGTRLLAPAVMDDAEGMRPEDYDYWDGNRMHTRSGAPRCIGRPANMEALAAVFEVTPSSVAAYNRVRLGFLRADAKLRASWGSGFSYAVLELAGDYQISLTEAHGGRGRVRWSQI